MRPPYESERNFVNLLAKPKFDLPELGLLGQLQLVPMKLFLLTVVSLFFSGCASTTIKQDPKLDVRETPTSSSEATARPEPSERSIDFLGLHRHLGLERAKEDLGYSEKSFDTCSVGFGFSSSSNCQRATFVVIHFQLLCRDSDGTLSTALAREDMKPLSGRSVRWTLKGSAGVMRLDGEGFGQIKTTVSNSRRLERLKLAVDNDFVYVRAGEVKRLVTPKNWCN